MYQTGNAFYGVSRLEADEVLKQFLKQLKVSKWRYQIIYYAVRLFGNRHFNK